MPVDPLVLRDTVIDYMWRTLWALLVVLATIAVGRTVRTTAIKALGRRRAHPNVVVLLGNLTQLAALLIGLLLVLAIYTQGAFGWILTSFSVLGLVVGLSLQDILKNFFAGIYILVERPFRIGDTVQVGVHTGVVQEISFRTMQLRTADGREVILPNASLMTDAVVNLTRYASRSARLRVVAPADQAGDVPERIRTALGSTDAVSDEPAPSVLLRGVANGKAQFDVTVWGPDRDRARGEAVAAIGKAGAEWDVQSA